MIQIMFIERDLAETVNFFIENTKSTWESV